MNKPTPKAVLWDLDGTIIDSITALELIINEVLPLFGLEKRSREDVRTEMHGDIQSVLRRLSNDYHDQETLLKTFFNSSLQKYSSPIAHTGIREAIKTFSSIGLQQAIVTSRANYTESDRFGAINIVKTMQLDLHIKTVVASEDVTHHKPHPEPILLALAKLGVAPQNAVMIGDQLVDVLAAKEAGVQCILIDHEKTPESQQSALLAGPDSICNDAPELITCVKQLLDI